MTRIVLISDTHGHHDTMDPIPAGDILIHAGDLTKHGALEELSGVAAFFAALPHKHKIIIAGNHDLCFEKNRDLAKRLLSGTTYLQDKVVTVMGLRIYGSPWQPRFGDWAFNLDRGEPLRERWSLIPSDTDILVTHGPPFGILDITDVERCHVGCRDLLEAVHRIQPKIHVFGHIHCNYGITTHGVTTYVNASICDESYNPMNAPIVIDL